MRSRVAPLTFVVVSAVVVLDQLTKWWAESVLDDRDIHVFWTLQLNLSYNTGMAFGRGRGMGPIIGVLAMVIIVVMLLSLRRGTSRLLDVSMGMVIGGAVGNLIDRLFRDPAWLRGGVVDFIDFQWFPIFNVADMGITVGGALLLVASWRAGIAESANEANGASDTADTPDASATTDHDAEAR